MRKAKVIATLALTVVMLAAMTGIAAASDDIMFWGYVTDSGGNPVSCTVKITNSSGGVIGEDPTDGTGLYNVPPTDYTLVADRNDTYEMFIDGSSVGSKYIDGWTSGTPPERKYAQEWSHRWDQQIPEFATIAIPVAAILGLVLFFNHRKRKKE